MDIYIVGGAVRDRLLGRAVVDRDWVVVGASPEMLQARGFRPVGKDFPVFLHPDTHEEYALARTERKTARGYHGFSFHASPDVTLEQDLARRDLTINAMAQAADGTIIDPYNGRADLKAGLLRHVSPAFAEDPVRILRIARFAARFGFAIAAETMQLMRTMVRAGEVDALVAERVWQEMAKALMETRPTRFFDVLRDCGALARLMPELERLFQPQNPQDGARAMQVLEQAARQQLPLVQRFAALMASLQQQTELQALCERLRVPAECRDLARLAWQQRHNIVRVAALPPDAILDLLRQTDALRRPERFRQLLTVIGVIGDQAETDHAQQSARWLEGLLEQLLALDSGAIARRCSDKSKIASAIDQARLEQVQAFRRATLPPQA